MPPPVIKSTHNDMPSYITFVNRTSDPIDVIWRDYHGKCVRYKERLEPGVNYFINTFVTHPWQAWYSDTYEDVNIDGRRFYMPVPWRGEENRTTVYIDRPLWSLLKISLRKVRSLVPPREVDSLDIPKGLSEQLRRRVPEPFRDQNSRPSS